ncbi:hypothetical protein C9975_03725 [Thalassospira xiamenensis]|nr:hypothetical protein C9975_03725 [Thalassospira xiamenensis]
MFFISDEKIFKLKHPLIKSISKKVIEIPIVDLKGSGSRERNCILNAEAYSKNNPNSKVVKGYTFSSLGNVLVRLIGHAVIIENGQLKCVTPPEPEYIRRRGTIHFLPADFDIINGRLPSQTISIVNHSVLERFAELENLLSAIKMKHPARESLNSDVSQIALKEEYIEQYNKTLKEYQLLIPKAEALALASMSRNDLCHCASGIKYKNCCMRP